MTRDKFAFTLVTLVALLFLSIAAAAPTLTFTFTDINAPGAIETDTYSINAKGAIGGDYVDSSNVQHGMILVGKKLTTIDNKDCQTTGATTGSIAFFGINSAQELAGWCVNNSTGVEMAFTWAKGKFTTIAGPKGNLGIEANGLNDKGEVVGTYVDSTGVQHGFVLSGKKYTNLDPPGVTTNVAWSINNSGLITVYGINSAGGYSSFTTKNNGKTYQPFAYSKAGTYGTVVHTVNDKGDIDGTYFDTNNYANGVLYHAKTYYSFVDPKADNSTRADGLNDTLHIVGRYTSESGTTQGYEAVAK